MNVDTIKDYLNENPTAKKWAIIGVGILAMWFLISMFSEESKTPEEIQKARIAKKEKSYFGVEDDLNQYDQNQAEDIVQSMRVKMSEQEQDFELKDKQRQDELKQLQKDQAQLTSQLYEMQQTMEAVLKNGGVTGGRADTVKAEPVNPQYQVQGDDRVYQGAYGSQGQQLQRRQTEIITSASQAEGNVIRTITQRSVREVEQSGKVSVKDIEVSRLSERTQEVDDSRKKNQKPNLGKGNNNRNTGEFTLAMGSIIGGTLINGVAAPTQVGSQENPVPVLLRVKRDAIMPNFHSLDIKECMILGSAIGNLASERANVRAEAISCITEDGKAIEKNITAYAVSSSDGLTGIRGTLVERSGKAVANSMKAGFLSGFADAASPQQVNALNTSPTATSAWQSQNLDKYAGAGMMKGAGNAMEKVAEYYMAIAEQMWPVIEVPAGIEVDFIVQKGMTLQLEDAVDLPQADEVASND